MKKFYLTTAIDYVNSLPHLGTAYEKIGADALARFLRMDGSSLHFQMGNDEHSANVKKEADRRGLPPKRYCDEIREKFEGIWRSLDISYDNFIQTSEPRHHAAVKVFLNQMKSEDIYTAPYEGFYCESCEAFLTEKDLVEKKCPTHKTEPKWLKEENYFFALSKYRDKLLGHYEKHPEFILPEIRKNEVVSFVRSELQDISISRATFPWGIPFPDDPTHVVYVWFDALINYLTAVGFGQQSAVSSRRFKELWPADLHIIGKDITRFHCVIWPAMLMSAGLPLPKTIFGHGFVFLKGEKMSKSLGNIVSPLDIVPKYGTDALRYYLLRESSFGSDGDFTWDNFIKRYNSDLANDLGNLLNRTLGMTNKYLGGQIARPKAAGKIPAEDERLQGIVEGALKKIRSEIDYLKTGDINFHKALAAIWEVISTSDKYIDTSAPWKLARENKREDIQRVLYNVADTLRNIAILIAPFIPQTSRKIWEQLGLGEKLKWEGQTFQDIEWGKTPPVQVAAGTPIFPRIETSPPAPLLSKERVAEGRVRSDQGEHMDTEIDITDFQKIDLRVAEVKQAEKVEGTDNLLKLQIEVGGEPRQIVAGIAQHYNPEELIGKKIVVVANLKPATIRGVESRGMLLAASDTEALTILTLDRTAIRSGAKVK